MIQHPFSNTNSFHWSNSQCYEMESTKGVTMLQSSQCPAGIVFFTKTLSKRGKVIFGGGEEVGSQCGNTSACHW